MAILDPRRFMVDASTHSGKANLDTSRLYDDAGIPIPQQDLTATLDANGLPLKPAKLTDDVMDGYKVKERIGAGFINPKGVATIGRTPKPTKFMFPRIQSVGNESMLEIVYTEECREVLILIQDKMEEMAKQNLKPATVLMGKHQYRQYMAVRSYQEGQPMLPNMIAEADIVIMDQEHYFDIVPSITNMITHKL